MIIVPSSKAHTIRALFIAALADGVSVLQNPLLSEDTLVAIDSLRSLGVKIDVDENIVVHGGTLVSGNVDIKKSGLSYRILTILGSLVEGGITITGDALLRPIESLLESALELGIKIEKEYEDDKFEINNKKEINLKNINNQNNNKKLSQIIIKKGFIGGKTKLNATSSQFLTALLLSAPYAENDVEIVVDKLVSKPYIDITLDVMKMFNVLVENEKYKKFIIKKQKYINKNYIIEGDYSNAAFWFAAAAITGKSVKIKGLNKESKQGDKIFLDLLEKMSCEVSWKEDYVEVNSNKLKSIEIDMNQYPDIVLPLCIVACFAEGTTKITNIKHLKDKECDRFNIVNELKKLGIQATNDESSITIAGGMPHSAEVETYDDHRIAMSFGIMSLVVRLNIKNKDCVKKSYPDFWKDLEKFKNS